MKIINKLEIKIKDNNEIIKIRIKMSIGLWDLLLRPMDILDNCGSLNHLRIKMLMTS